MYENYDVSLDISSIRGRFLLRTSSRVHCNPLLYYSDSVGKIPNPVVDNWKRDPI